MIFQQVTHELSVGRCDRCHSEVRLWRGESEAECNACGAIYTRNGDEVKVEARRKP